MTIHVVIPDTHARNGDNFTRFGMAGQLCLDIRPDVIISLGDFGDIDALCSYDKGKKDFEGRRYRQDVAAVEQALRAFNQPIDDYNNQQVKNKKAQWKPRKVICLGNHEYRIERAVQMQPELEGTIGIENLKFEEYGWEVIPYEKPYEIDGIWYCHFLPSGVKGEAISGYNLGASLISKHFVSCTVGHSHLFDHAVRTSPSGRKIHGLSAGCFLEGTPNFAANTAHLWWRGIVVKHNVCEGDYDLEQISLARLKKIYG